MPTGAIGKKRGRLFLWAWRGWSGHHARGRRRTRQRIQPRFLDNRIGRRRALALIAVVCCMCSSPANVPDAGLFGSVKLIEPNGQGRAVVIYFSGGRGLSSADEGVAQTLAKAGALVAEVDSREYLSRLDKTKEKCHSLVYDAELSLVLAPSATIADALSLDPDGRGR